MNTHDHDYSGEYRLNCNDCNKLCIGGKLNGHLHIDLRNTYPSTK